LAGGAIGDLDFEVKWGRPCEEFCPGGDCCVLETEVMTAEELLERYAAGERDFRSIKLSKTVVGDIDNRQRVIPEGMSLENIDLSSADLRGADFTGINLSGANFHKAGCDDARFNRANLSRANLSRAIFENTGFSNTNLIGANFSSAYIGPRCSFFQADLSNANLTEVEIVQSHFKEANFTGANLSRATAIEAIFDRSNFTRANLSEIGWENIRIDGAIFQGTILPNFTFDSEE
jgi:2-iminobutanoate/2-iminopropanoate deaminase